MKKGESGNIKNIIDSGLRQTHAGFMKHIVQSSKELILCMKQARSLRSFCFCFLFLFQLVSLSGCLIIEPCTRQYLYFNQNYLEKSILITYLNNRVIINLF